MKQKLLLFVLFAATFIAFKLLTPWVPVDCLLALCFWVGIQIKHSSSFKIRFVWITLLLSAIFLGDWLFQLHYDGP